MSFKDLDHKILLSKTIVTNVVKSKISAKVLRKRSDRGLTLKISSKRFKTNNGYLPNSIKS